MTRQEIKEWSKQKIKGNMWTILGAILIANLVSSITSVITVENEFVALAITIVGGVLSFIMQIGLVKYMINFITDKQNEIEVLFSKFKDWKQATVVYLHQFINVFLWTLLFIIPGIIKGYAYSLVTYILADNSKISSKEVLKLSEEMMNGHKMQLFTLELSFVGWHLLAILTLGILEIWLIPYQQTATAKFLLDVKESYEKANNNIQQPEVI